MGRDEGSQVLDPGSDVRWDGRGTPEPAAELGLVSAGAAGELTLGPADDDEAAAEASAGHGGGCGGGVFALNTGSGFRNALGKSCGGDKEVWQGVGHL